MGVAVRAGTETIGGVRARLLDYGHALGDPLRFLDPGLTGEAKTGLEGAMAKGDSLGGTVRLEATGLPPGLGDPVFDKLEALLGRAFFSVGAVRAVEFGEGIRLASALGSEANDPIGRDGPEGDLHGGILGGISTGRPLIARLFVRPTPSLSLSQRTVGLDLEPCLIETHGRHDPCIAPRLCPVAEAMALIVLADLHLEGIHRL
jgi:chorismate synthase